MRKPGTIGSAGIGLTLVLVSLAAAAAPASAKVFQFQGTAKADAQTKITFDVNAVVKRVKLKNGKHRKKFVAKTVSNVHVIDQLFTCYDAGGNPATSGRATLQYSFYSIPPMAVDKKGKFSGLYEYGGSDPITRETFAGRFTGRKATGTFRAQYDPGGISFGYCGNKTPEPWTGKVTS